MTRLLLFACILFIPGGLLAQTDTLRYDNLLKPFDGQLLAAAQFEGELDAVFNGRFTPKEKCRLVGAMIGFSVVKFQPATGNDTLLVYVYERTPVPPQLACVGTYKVNLGDVGFPAGNINYINPLNSGARDQLRVDFVPPLIIAPKRDFLIGIALQSKQRMSVSPIGRWNGLCVVLNPFQPEYQRYGRYQILGDSRFNANLPVMENTQATLFLRALVQYDPTLPNTALTGSEQPAAPAGFVFSQNYPNPFRDVTGLDIVLDREQAVTLTVSDMLGRGRATLIDAVLPAGTHHAEFAPGDPPDAASGNYLATLRAGGRIVTKLMTRLR
jgi:hypothetical protein